MNVAVADYLRLVENNHSIVFFDTESLGLNGDYGSLLCGSFKPYGKKPYNMRVEQPGNDKKLARMLRDELAKYDCWVTFYGRGHDIPLLETRLLVHGLPAIDKKLHLDVYWKIKGKLKTARKSQAHINRLLDTQEQKLSVNPNDWNAILYDKGTWDIMVKRCNSDVEGLEDLYDRVKHLVGDIAR